jgi:hypothetical protein
MQDGRFQSKSMRRSIKIATRISGDEMKLCARMLATMAVAFSLPSTLLLHAEYRVKPSDKARDRAVDFRVAPATAAQSKMSVPTPPLRHNASKAEFFLGYSYFRGVPALSPGNRMVGLNGGRASIAFDLNRYLGLIADFGGYHATALRLTGAGAVLPRVADASGTAYTSLFGPRFSYRKYNRITPFTQILFGGVHASQVTLSGCTGSLCTPLPTQNGFAMTAGGGFDIRVFRHLSIRAIQAEYMMTRFGDPTMGVSQTQTDLRLSSGLIYRFGDHPPR